MSKVKLGVIGAGNIAHQHLEVTRDIDNIMIVGITSRTRSKAEVLSSKYRIPNVATDISELVTKCQPDGLLVLVSADEIFEVTKEVVTKKLPFFVEKPPGLSPAETLTLSDSATKYGVRNMVGFNRRYYSIFHKGLARINENGKLLGVMIEGHERFWRISSTLNESVRSAWIYANSTHTIDLLRFFGGEVTSIHALSERYIEKRGDQFAAVVKYESGALGNYISNWYSPGGWSAKLFGEGVTVQFGPLEKGWWIGTDLVTHKIIPDDVDIKYKPGFYRQMEVFEELVRGSSEADWPAQDLGLAYKTMQIAEELVRSR